VILRWFEKDVRVAWAPAFTGLDDGRVEEGQKLYARACMGIGLGKQANDRLLHLDDEAVDEQARGRDRKYGMMLEGV
jgi:hypothetical protein